MYLYTEFNTITTHFIKSMNNARKQDMYIFCCFHCHTDAYFGLIRTLKMSEFKNKGYICNAITKLIIKHSYTIIVK
jgi:hypothetical protein